jgi:LPXTG-motif cell wall-anchored protein
MGTGYALRVSLDLRPLFGLVPGLEGVVNTLVGAIPGASMDTPGVIDQYLIRTTSDADGSVNKARSSLAEGLLDLDVVEATNVGQIVEKTVQNIALPSESLKILDGDLGLLRAAVTKGTDVDGAGTLNELNVGLPIDALPGVQALLDGLLDLEDPTSALSGLSETLEGVLGGVLGNAATQDSLVGGLTDAVGGLTGGALGNLAGGLGVPVTAVDDPTEVAGVLDGLLDVDALLDQLLGTLTESLDLGKLASLTDLVNNTKALQIAGDGTAVAESVASLASLDVLGGLVDVGLFNLSSKSMAAGTPGSAKNVSSCSLADVKIGGGALGISLDGTNIFIGGQAVPVVGDLVGTVKGLVDGILNTLGLDVALCDVAQKEADPDGTAAAQRVSALRVELAPLGLFRLIIDPTVETAVAAAVGTPQVSTNDPAPNLPKTGAPIVATVLSGIALAGGAMLVRRRLS